jgi:hypothetical protein
MDPFLGMAALAKRTQAPLEAVKPLPLVHFVFLVVFTLQDPDWRLSLSVTGYSLRGHSCDDSILKRTDVKF